MKLRAIVIAVAAALSTGAFAADQAKQPNEARGKDSPAVSQPQGAKAEGSASAGSSSAGSGSASAGASGKQAGQQRNAEGSGEKAMSRSGGGQAHSADMVKNVQQSLKDKGIDAGPVDGKFGPLTQKGVKQFQEQQKMKATGRLDQQTLSALGVSGSASAGASGQAAPAKDGAKASGSAS